MLSYGSVKTNPFGHLLEGAAASPRTKRLGLAARLIPADLHFEQLNPHIALEGTRLMIPREGRAGSRRRAPGQPLSSFGWSGTNAHPF